MSVIKTGTTSTTGYIVESDTNGNLVIQTGSTPTTALTLNSDQTATFAQSVNIPNTFGFKNRIINGAMMIDQRNAGASVTINGNGLYTLDRWYSDDVSDGSWTIQQSSVAPSGFSNSLLVTITSADSSISATERCRLMQFVEGFNMADFAWGTASAAPITLSFWVRSSVTGTFSGALLNSAENRSYPFTYVVNSANTFEYKTITIAGDTSGTWVTNNGIGIRVVWSLGMGSNFNGTAGAWNSSTNFAATGATNLISTNGATFYITGVQLEKGSTATSFDYRPYGTELALCQRYYEALSANAGSAPAAGGFFALGVCELTTRVQPYYTFKVVKRAAPSTTLSAIGTFGLRSTTSSFACTSGTFGAPTNAYAQGEFNNGGGGLVAGGCGWLTNHTGAATIEWSAEL